MGKQLTEKEPAYREFIRREDSILRAPYNPELEFYSTIKAGDVRRAEELCSVSFAAKEGLGTLSDDVLQNWKYHLVVTIAMIARYCIEGGMELSTSYSLSDYYIRKTDNCKNLQEIDKTHKDAVMDYTGRMRQLRKKKICSLQVAKCIDYINDHLHCRITAADLADYVHLNESYLSRLFKKEVGVPISEYIRSLKLETAENMLVYSEYSVSEIAADLAFSDQSYFTEQFRKRTGMTPLQYRRENLRQTEMGEV